MTPRVIRVPVDIDATLVTVCLRDPLSEGTADNMVLAPGTAAMVPDGWNVEVALYSWHEHRSLDIEVLRQFSPGSVDALVLFAGIECHHRWANGLDTIPALSRVSTIALLGSWSISDNVLREIARLPQLTTIRAGHRIWSRVTLRDLALNHAGRADSAEVVEPAAPVAPKCYEPRPTSNITTTGRRTEDSPGQGTSRQRRPG